MPQLAKGGKYVFGWSRVGDDGEIALPPEALAEYGLERVERVILMPGSRTSGGFGVTTAEKLETSPIWGKAAGLPEISKYGSAEGKIVEFGSKAYCWVRQRGGRVKVPPETLRRYGVEPGGRLLVVRGSGLALGFIVRGPIVEQARRHAGLRTFE